MDALNVPFQSSEAISALRNCGDWVHRAVETNEAVARHTSAPVDAPLLPHALFEIAVFGVSVLRSVQEYAFVVKGGG